MSVIGGQVLLDRITNNLTGFSHLIVALGGLDSPPVTGTARVRGAGSEIRITGILARLSVGRGRNSFGSLRISEGGQVILENPDNQAVGAVGWRESDPLAVPDPVLPATGNVLVSGAGSLLDTGELLICGKQLLPPFLAPFDIVDGGRATIQVRDGGVVRATDIIIGPDCVVFGDGTLDGNVTIEGTVIPGNSPGILTVTKTVTVAAGGIVVLEVNGTEAGQFDALQAAQIVLEEGAVMEIVLAEELDVEEVAALPVIAAAEIQGTVQVVVVTPGEPEPEVFVLEVAEGTTEIEVTVSSDGVESVGDLGLLDIDIKPGSFPNSINLGSNGAVPVAVFSTAGFDATTVDPSTLVLGGSTV